ncbi:hypothetical protein ACFQ0K_13380 [Nocardioides caeni]|uniref:Uncharacterized protein n=1 Tax=Nocardioides caeni TaxID=574700 RepID=A0A4S8MZ95_9ACTN|nr:hypothetical protein [Nocardioides caeni]THV08788.1 hypothetical protein E9934_19030 [Nocardioides caeni]
MIGLGRRRPGLAVASGERILAWAELTAPEEGDRRAVAGTRDALYLPHRVPWEQVATATWDEEAGALRVVEVGRFGAEQPVHLLPMRDAGRLLQLVRERVTASMALQRHVPLADGRAIRVIARRSPGGHGDIAWFVDYDDGLDPADPAVLEQVERALASAQDELGR